jgi:membrane-associated protease RseP (regulator of RpoE activity)
VPAAPAGPLSSGSSGSELDRIRRIVTTYFPIYDTRVGPQSLILAVQIDPTQLETKFDRLRRELWTAGYVPILRRQMGEDFLEVIPRPRLRTKRQWVNLALLAATVVTTTFAGALIWLSYVGGTALTARDFAYGALYFSVPVLTILGLHELAHYFMARRRTIDASLPYFIPLPPPFLFGTFGAFISIREPFPDKKALFDIGAAGPLAGFAASIPIALAGLYLSSTAPVLPATYCGVSIIGVNYNNIILGVPLFWQVLSLFFPPSLVSLHPLALAGWVGIFVTAINLLPAGQLDGGHVFRALLGDRVRFVGYAAVILLFGLGLFYTGWLFFGVLVLLLGVRHPPPLNDVSPLDTKRYIVGALVVVILISGFVVVPLATPTGSVSLSAAAPTYPASEAGVPVRADLNFTVVNQDPVSHAFTFTASVLNVTIRGAGNQTVYLNSTALAAWQANASWTFHLPGGHDLTLTGGSVSLPSADAVSVNGTSAGDSYVLFVSFANTNAATSVLVEMAASEYCASSGTGYASTTATIIPS